jgi:hypothetical protein
MIRNAIALTLAALAFSGCIWAHNVMAPAPAANAGFGPDESYMKYEKKIPMDRVWWDTKGDFSKYKKIYIAPVNTDHVLKMDFWQKLSLGEKELGGDLAKNAKYFQTAVHDSFKNDPKHHFTVVETPDDQTLIVELAITEMTPNKPWLNAIAVGSLAAGPIVGFVAGTAATLNEHGSVAFEGRTRDGKTKAINAMAADHENGKIRVIDFQSFTWYGQAPGIFRDWAELFVKIADAPAGSTIEPDSFFELKPW